MSAVRARLQGTKTTYLEDVSIEILFHAFPTLSKSQSELVNGVKGVHHRLHQSQTLLYCRIALPCPSVPRKPGFDEPKLLLDSMKLWNDSVSLVENDLAAVFLKIQLRSKLLQVEWDGMCEVRVHFVRNNQLRLNDSRWSTGENRLQMLQNSGNLKRLRSGLWSNRDQREGLTCSSRS